MSLRPPASFVLWLAGSRRAGRHYFYDRSQQSEPETGEPATRSEFHLYFSVYSQRPTTPF